MSTKCIKIGNCACFLAFSCVLFVLAMLGPIRGPFGSQGETITFSRPEVQCYLEDMSESESTEVLKLKAPSLESFIRASTAMEDQELRLSGLAVFSKLANACQPLADVSKAKTQVNKVAFISVANRPEAVCPVQGLVEHAQNAGYSVVIFLDDLYSHRFDKKTQLQDKLLIPVLHLLTCYNHSYLHTADDDHDLLAADRTNVEIAINPQPAEDLKKMQQYLRRLYYWFL